MDLMSMLLGSMTSGASLDALTGKTGASGKQTSKLLTAALPLLLKSLTKNASSADGAQSLLGALSQHTSTKSMASQIADADEEDGAKIIGHILGNNQADVVSALAKESGMESAQVSQTLGALAPALMSGLSAATNSGKKDDKGTFDLSDMAGMFGADASAASAASGLLGGGGLGSMLGSLLGGGKDDDASASGNELLSTLTGMMK